MYYCPKCEKEYEDEDMSFCPECGTLLKRKAEVLDEDEHDRL